MGKYNETKENEKIEDRQEICHTRIFVTLKK